MAMMDYETFKGIVLNEFKNYLSDDLRDREFTIHKVNKVNQIMDGMTIGSPKNGNGEKFAPTIYVNNMYEQYKELEDLEQVLKHNAQAYERALEQGVKYVTMSEDLLHKKDKIVFELINAEQNEELLRGIPYRPFYDLAVIYRVVIEVGEQNIASAIVTNDMAMEMGLTEEELFRHAAENTRSLFPVEIKPISQIMREILERQGMEEGMIECLIPEPSEREMMYVISNNMGINGAAAMLYEKELGELADKIDSDLIILPSSVHEVIAVPDLGGDPLEMADMVREVNQMAVRLEERLSNQVYKYDRQERKLSKISGIPEVSIAEGESVPTKKAETIGAGQPKR